MEQQERGSNAGSILLAFFIGGLVGAGVALLTAPQAGSETRKKIKEFAEDTKDKAEVYYDKVKDKTESAIEKGKEFIDEKKTVITKAVEAGKEAFNKEKDKVIGEQES